MKKCDAMRNATTQIQLVANMTMGQRGEHLLLSHCKHLKLDLFVSACLCERSHK